MDKCTFVILLWKIDIQCLLILGILLSSTASPNELWQQLGLFLLWLGFEICQMRVGLEVLLTPMSHFRNFSGSTIYHLAFSCIWRSLACSGTEDGGIRCPTFTFKTLELRVFFHIFHKIIFLRMNSVCIDFFSCDLWTCLFTKFSFFVQSGEILFLAYKCVGPENIHIPATEGIGISLEGRGVLKHQKI